MRRWHGENCENKPSGDYHGKENHQDRQVHSTFRCEGISPMEASSGGSERKGANFPGMRRMIAESERSAVVGRYVIDDRWTGKNRREDD